MVMFQILVYRYISPLLECISQNTSWKSSLGGILKTLSNLTAHLQGASHMLGTISQNTQLK